MGFAPIGLFAYNRPEHLARALGALARCPELASSSLTIFCDGAKPNATAETREKITETRRGARELAPKAQIVEREHNLGLAASMRAGVTALCDEHGRAIILEDDLEVSTTFLRFMNESLDRYADEPRVMQVSGYMFPVDIRGVDDALFVPLISCWGWGVWSRSWAHFDKHGDHYDQLARDAAARRRFDLDGAFPYFAMLESQHRGEVDSWGIRWYLDVFATGGLVLYPRLSLVANRGHDGSGAHQELASPFEADAHDFAPKQFPEVAIDVVQNRQLIEFVRRKQRGGLVARAGRLIQTFRSRLGVR
jgi:GT2 family glycosyltransferase